VNALRCLNLSAQGLEEFNAFPWVCKSWRDVTYGLLEGYYFEKEIFASKFVFDLLFFILNSNKISEEFAKVFHVRFERNAFSRNLRLTDSIIFYLRKCYKISDQKDLANTFSLSVYTVVYKCYRKNSANVSYIDHILIPS